MILEPEDMPQTASGLIPDIIINPHCIPSRMTIAQLMETLLGKIGAELGCLGDGTPFNKKMTLDGLAKVLRDDLGLEPYGNEIMYNGLTGRQMETNIFVGPVFYQRLRHCSADKLHSRASGPLVMLTRQPAEGRAREGGLRFGEMERDCVIAHGMSEFTKERLMECSDAFRCFACRDCGLLAVVNPVEGIWNCRSCGNTTNFTITVNPTPVVAATPTGKWAPNPKVVEIAKTIAAKNGGKVEVVHDPESASKDASVLYTDVWMSMGDSESERDEKVLALSPFAVTENLFSLTNKDSIFMHCLPAHRGEEVEASVIDGPRSVIWREAYHRRTTIQSLLFHLTKGDLKGN
jgi:ribosomal protein L37AE/L43A